MYEAARITDQIKHSGATWGTAIGTIAGVAALIPGPGTVAAVVLGVVALAAPLLGGLIHYNAGPIATGAKGVFIGRKKAARAKADRVECDDPKVIAQGSRTVAIENYPAARIDDQTQCGGSIGEGFPTVFIGREPATYVNVESEVPAWLQIAYLAAGLSGLVRGSIEALLGSVEREAAGALTEGTSIATRTFYSVQDEADAARLLAGGEPWPTSMSKSLLGEGVGSSRVDLQACKLEYSIVSPK